MLLQYACVLRQNKKETEAALMETRATSITFKESAGQSNVINLPGDCSNAVSLSLPRPAYPERAKKEMAGGEVVVEVVIDEVGNVVAARALSGHYLLKDECVRAAYQAKFKPMIVGGKPIKVFGIITYNFTATILTPRI
jgi:TonB family protein